VLPALGLLPPQPLWVLPAPGLEDPQPLDVCPDELLGIRLAPATKLLMQSPASNFFKFLSSTITLLSTKKMHRPRTGKILAFLLFNLPKREKGGYREKFVFLKIHTLF
jgi:hypothetical protein